MGLRIRDIGETLTWTEFRAFIKHLPPTVDSALFRAQYPNSWWWTPETDFYAAMLHSLQNANWQRGGGKGTKPKAMKRPKDRSAAARHNDPKSGSELAARKKRMEDEVAKRQRREAVN